MQTELNPTIVTLQLGNTLAERLTAARGIVTAMTTAVLMMYEHDMAEKDNPDMEVFTNILLEAQLAVHLLEKQ